MKVSGVIGIVILVLSLIFIAVIIVSSLQEKVTLNDQKTIYQWLSFIVLCLMLILLLIFFSGFIQLGSVAHNRKLKFTSIIIVVFLIISLGVAIFSFMSKSDPNPSAQTDFGMGGLLSNKLSGMIYTVNLIYLGGILFIVAQILFFLSLIDIYFESNINYSRLAGTMGVISLALVVFLMMGVFINGAMLLLETLAGSFGAETTSSSSSIFIYLYLFVIYALFFAVTLLLSLTLFSANKKYEGGKGQTNVQIPNQTLKSITPPQGMPQINIPQSNPPVIQSSGYELPKIVEREKKN